MSEVAAHLERTRSSGLFRSVQVDEEGVDFVSNDYLGLSRSPAIRLGLEQALREGCPLGATGSRLLGGTTEVHERVEVFLAEMFGAESALLFGSGYLANMAVIGALGSLGDVEVFSDEKNHASLIDGVRLTKAKRSIFAHNSIEHLASLLETSTAKTKIVACESVYSMDGDLAPLASLAELASHFDAWLVVDEAHATGVFGPRGLGRTEALSQDERLIVIHTAGKALGAQGAFVLSNGEIRDLLINHGRSFIYTTAPAPLAALQIELAVRHMQGGERCLRNASLLRSLLDPTVSQASLSQILPVHLGSNEKALRAAGALREAGFLVRAVRAPTVPPGTERLRLTCKAFHTEAEIRTLASVLREIQ